MNKRTRDYAKDYQRIGSTVQYTGKHYRLSMAQPELNRRKIAYLSSFAAAAGFFVALGLSGSKAFGGQGTQAAIYVVLPYVGLLLPFGLAFARALLLAVKTRPLEYAEYDKYLVQQKGFLYASLALSGVLALGQIAFSLFGNHGAVGRELTAIGETLLCAGCIFMALRQYHALFCSVSIDETSTVRYDS